MNKISLSSKKNKQTKKPKWMHTDVLRDKNTMTSRICFNLFQTKRGSNEASIKMVVTVASE